MTNSSSLRAICFGIGLTFLASLAVAALLAAVINSGTLPEGTITGAAMAVSLIAAGIGGFFSGQIAGTAKLPMAMLSGLGYLLIAFLLRAAVFHTVGDNLWQMPVCVLAGSALGGFLSAGKNTRGANVKNRRKHVEISKKL